MKNKFKDLTGQVFGKLTVIERAENDKWAAAQWLCECECGNKIVVKGGHLRSGGTKSCRCRTYKYKNGLSYDLSGEYGIGYTSKDEPFYFDLEDYDLIKDYSWYINNKYGYCMTVHNNKTIYIHRLIMNDPEFEIDHINRNKSDNRKSNLRIVTSSQNNMNQKINMRNKSGVTGVYWYEKNNKWIAYINLNKKRYNLGYFDNKDTAIIARLKAEKEYFGEFSSQKHLFEQYGVS